MASGHLCLNLSSKVSWEEFPIFANQLLLLLEGSVLEQADGVDMRLWNVLIAGKKLRLVFDDYPVMASIESASNDGDSAIQEIHTLLVHRNKTSQANQ